MNKYFIFGKFKKIFIRLSLSFVLFFPLWLGSAKVVKAAIYYASTSGSGSTCTEQNPCTYSSGISKLVSGDALLLGAGTYNVNAFSINKSNVTVGAKGDGEVIFYGGYTEFGTRKTYTPLITVSGSSTTLRDITVANSPGEGIEVTGSSSQLINVFVHHSGENGIILKGNYTLCDGCRSWSNAESNHGGTQSVGWGTGISACRHPQHATIRNSVAWENWGEGISTFESEYTTLEYNTSYNNWSGEMYISDTAHSIARGNLIYRTANNMGGLQGGLALGDEVSNPRSSDNIIVNNFVIGTNRAFWSWDNIQTNLVVANNTFVNSANTNTVTLTGGTNNVFRNNIIIQDNNLPVIGGSTSGYTFSNNIWSKTPTGLTLDSGSKVGDPQLARVGTIAPGELTGDWFKLTAASTLAIDKALADQNVVVDFFKTSRPYGAAPDIGGHEYIGDSTLTPTQTQKSGDANADGKVDGIDYIIWLNHFGQNIGGANNGDFNGSGSVDITDYIIWLINYF